MRLTSAQRLIARLKADLNLDVENLAPGRHSTLQRQDGACTWLATVKGQVTAVYGFEPMAIYVRKDRKLIMYDEDDGTIEVYAERI